MFEDEGPAGCAVLLLCSSGAPPKPPINFDVVGHRHSPADLYDAAGADDGTALDCDGGAEENLNAPEPSTAGATEDIGTPTFRTTVV